MSAYSVVLAKHQTLSTTVQDTVTLTGVPTRITVVNRHATEILTVRIGWSSAPADITTALEDDTDYVPAGGFVTFTAPEGINSVAPVVKLKGSANTYSVVGER